jgi:hypothetical protein
MKKMTFSHMLERRGWRGVAIYSLGEWCTKVSVTLSLSAEWSFSAKYRKSGENVASAAPPPDCRLRQPGGSIPRGII